MKNIRRIFKTFFIMILTLTAIFFSYNNVKAETKTVAEGATLYDGYSCSETNDCTWLHYKSMGGTAAYCLNFNKTTPAGQTVTNNSSEYSSQTLKDITAIILTSYSKTVETPSTFTEDEGHYRYFITELALNKKLGIKDSFSVSDITTTYINELSAITAPADQTLSQSGDPTWHTQNLNNNNISGNYVITPNTISYRFSNSNATYTVSTSGVDGVIVVSESGETKNTFKSGEGFKLKIPVSSIPSSGQATVTIKVTGSLSYTTYTEATVWVPSDISSYQSLATPGEKITKRTTANGTDGKINITLTTGALISKVDKDTKEMIAGAKLKVEDANGKEVDEWTSTKEAHLLSGLTPGSKYYLVEVSSPAGYMKESKRQEFTVALNETTKVVMENKKVITEVVKIDKTTKENVSGATLQILDKEKKAISCLLSDNENGTNASISENCTWVSGTKPKYIVGLAAGDYFVKETKAPDGYVKSSEYKSFKVSSTKNVSVTFDNQKTITKISKVDITTKDELSGATIQVLDSNKKPISCLISDKEDGTDTSVSANCTWVSGEKPKYIIGLKAGTYYLKETKAPDGYDLSSEIISFTVEKDGSVDPVVMTNSKTSIVKISKVDITTKEELPGARLQILDKNKKKVTCIIVDANGEPISTASGYNKTDCTWVSGDKPHYIIGLKAGTYYLVEITAPNGYELNKEEIKFEIEEGKVTMPVVMENSKVPDVPVEDTFSTTSIIMIGFGIILIASGVGLIIYIKKAKKEN